jgi:hypothetical protein
VAFWSRKGPSGIWGSTAATILSLKAQVWAAGGAKHKDLTPFPILVNGKEVTQGEVTEANADMLQLFDVKEHLRPGVNEVTLKVKGETNLRYPIVGRPFEPWRPDAPRKVLLEVAVESDRTKLSTADLLLYEQAVIAEGSRIKDPTGSAQRINELLVQSMTAILWTASSLPDQGVAE